MYNTEKDLVLDIKKILHSTTSTDSPFTVSIRRKIFEELNLGYGIPDIVVVNYNNSSSSKSRKNFLNYFDISVLEIIESKNYTSFDDIIFLTRSSKSKIKKTLKLLEAESLINYREGKYFLNEKYSTTLEGSIAIEAKLKNWGKALKQAYRYKWFSQKSFVFLPNKNIKPALAKIELFMMHQVGLAGIDIENGITVYFDPIENKPFSESMYKLLNEYLVNDLNSVSE